MNALKVIFGFFVDQDAPLDRLRVLCRKIIWVIIKLFDDPSFAWGILSHLEGSHVGNTESWYLVNSAKVRYANQVFRNDVPSLDSGISNVIGNFEDT